MVVAYHILLAPEWGEHYDMPPELTEEEQLQVDVIVSAEEEKRDFSGFDDALASSTWAAITAASTNASKASSHGQERCRLGPLAGSQASRAWLVASSSSIWTSPASHGGMAVATNALDNQD
jgi:hypothetical protein